jgi:hypothetical protein
MPNVFWNEVDVSSAIRILGPAVILHVIVDGATTRVLATDTSAVIGLRIDTFIDCFFTAAVGWSMSRAPSPGAEV